MTWSPGAVIETSAVFSSASVAGSGVLPTVGTVASSASDTSGPDGGVPVAVATFETEPAATSAAVTVCVWVGSSGQVVDAFGARLSTHGAATSPSIGSEMVTSVRSVLPMLVTVKP